MQDAGVEGIRIHSSIEEDEEASPLCCCCCDLDVSPYGRACVVPLSSCKVPGRK